MAVPDCLTSVLCRARRYLGCQLRIAGNLHGYGSYPPRAEPGHDPGISSCTLATYPLVHQPYHFGGVTKMMADKPPAIIR